MQAQVAKSKGKSGSVLSYFSREARGKSGNCSGTSSETSISSNSGKNIKKRKDQKDTQSHADYDINKHILPANHSAVLKLLIRERDGRSKHVDEEDAIRVEAEDVQVQEIRNEKGESEIKEMVEQIGKSARTECEVGAVSAEHEERDKDREKSTELDVCHPFDD